MECRRHGQPLGGEPGCVHVGFDRFDGSGRARQHDLAPTVVVRDHHVAARLFDDVADRVDLPADRRHRTGGLCGFGHQHAPLSGDTDHVGLRQGACCMQRGDLAEAVSANVARCESDRIEHTKQAEAGRADRRLRPLCSGEQRLVDAVGAVLERPDREDDVVERVVVPVLISREIPSVHRLVEVHREVGAHEEVLAALAGEDERDVTRRSAGSVVDAGRGRPRPIGVGGDPLDPLGELGAELGLVAGREREARRCVGHVRPLAGLGQEGQIPVELGFVGVVSSLSDQVIGVGAAEHDQLDIGGSQPRGASAGSRVLREGDVEVRSAESERADRSAPFVFGSAHPRSRPGVQVKRRPFQVEARIGPIDLGGLGEHLVMQRHHDLEETCRAGGRLGVADLALDRSERTPLPVGAVGGVERELESPEFGGVARNGAGAVGLDQLDGVGSVGGLRVRVLERPRLARRDRRVHALGSAVGAGADAVDDAVDVVAVAFGIVETLQRHHADAFAEHRAVGLVGKRPDVLGLGQGRRLRKAHVHEDVVHGVDAPGDHQVAVAEIQLVDPHRDRRERRCARRVGDAVGAAEVETVGDASRDDISEQSGEGALGPLGMQGEDLITRGLGDVFGHAGATHPLEPHGPVHAAGHGAEQLLTRRHAEDHRRPSAVEFAELAA